MKLLGQKSLLELSVIEAAAAYNLDSHPSLVKGRSHLTKSEMDPDVGTQSNSRVDEAERIASRMTQLLDVLPGGVIVVDGQGIVQQCNAVAIDLLGESLEGEKWITIIQRAFSAQSQDGYDSTLIDGRLVHISTNPLKAEPGQIVFLQDVTETRELQQKVSHLQRLSEIGEMAARLAHQIRTPLSSALLYLAPLLKPEGGEDLKLRFAKRLHKSISQVEHLVKDMLAFSRGDMAETEPVPVADILMSVEQQFLAQLDIDSFNFSVENNVDNACVYGCKEALSSAITNLVSNARLACENNGEINIFADLVQNDDGLDCIEFSVEDNGSGILEQDQDKIMTPFYTTRSSGTGLGLAVVKSIVNAHKGEFWFESIYGEGSTFCLRLPLYQTAEQFTLTTQKN